MAAAVPAQLAAVTTSLSGSNVIIDWNPTSNDHGSTVTKYRVLFETNGGTFTELTSACNGADATVTSNTLCPAIAMSVFTSAPLSLPIGSLIVATVEAYNDIGYSTPSLENTVGVTAMKAP